MPRWDWFAALAWNEAIKATIIAILGEGNGLVGLYIYALLATVVAVTVLIALARAAARIGGETLIVREAEG